MNRSKLAAVFLFGIFFGLLEAIVVVYLQNILNADKLLSYSASSSDVQLSLGVIAFLKPEASGILMQSSRILFLEQLREGSTIIMLLSLAWAVSKKFKEGLAYFLLAFATWDIFYYIFLRVITGWPNSLLDLDLFFLLPVAWVGPVITPITISLGLIIASIYLLKNTS